MRKYMDSYGKDMCGFCGKDASGYGDRHVYTCVSCGVSWYRSGGICNLRKRVASGVAGYFILRWYKPPLGCLVVGCEVKLPLVSAQRCKAI